MNAQTLTATLLVLAGGVALAVQAPINAALSRAVGAPGLAALVSFLVGTLALLGWCFVSGLTISGERLASAPWWAWLGGLAGAFYMVAMISGLPRLGVVTTIAAIVLGQLVTALLLDATGAFGLAVQPVSPSRLVAVALVMGAVVLSRF